MEGKYSQFKNFISSREFLYKGTYDIILVGSYHIQIFQKKKKIA